MVSYHFLGESAISSCAGIMLMKGGTVLGKKMLISVQLSSVQLYYPTEVNLFCSRIKKITGTGTTIYRNT